MYTWKPVDGKQQLIHNGKSTSIELFQNHEGWLFVDLLEGERVTRLMSESIAKKIAIRWLEGYATKGIV